MFLSLFLTVRINFQYKLKYHTSFLIETFFLFSSIASLTFFSFAVSLVFHVICDYKFVIIISMCKWVLSLAVPYFVSNFNSRKSKNELQKKSKLKHFPFTKWIQSSFSVTFGKICLWTQVISQCHSL